MLAEVQSHAAAHTSAPDKALRITTAARSFEAIFVSQMLQASGVDKPPDYLGGGIGEQQFASFLTDAHAKVLVERGGIGLAESLIRAMAKGA